MMKMKLIKAIFCVLLVSMLVSMAIPMVAAKPPKPPAPPADPAIAFDTRESVPHGDIFRIWVMNADGSNKAMIFESMGDYYISGGVSWSPDGKSLAWAEVYTALEPYVRAVSRIDVEIVDGVPHGTNLQKLVETTDTGATNARWSPRGDEIAYMSSRSIRAVPAAGGTPYDIYSANVEEAQLDSGFGLTWNWDGTQLACREVHYTLGESILIVDRATGSVADRLLTGQYLNKQGFDWARQGVNKIAFSNDGIKTVDIETEEVVPIVAGGQSSWSPDNSKIVYIIKKGRGFELYKIMTYEFSTGKITTLAENDNYKNPDWRRF